jgi:hypothetical protein
MDFNRTGQGGGAQVALVNLVDAIQIDDSRLAEVGAAIATQLGWDGTGGGTAAKDFIKDWIIAYLKLSYERGKFTEHVEEAPAVTPPDLTSAP